MKIVKAEDAITAAVGYYVDVYSKLGGFDVYVLLCEPNSEPTPYEVEAITQTVTAYAGRNLTDIYWGLERLNLNCLTYGFNLIENS